MPDLLGKIWPHDGPGDSGSTRPPHPNFVVCRRYRFLPVLPAIKNPSQRGSSMRAFRFVIATIAAVALAHIPGGAKADAVKQVQLTDKQIDNYLASQKEISALMQKMQGGQNNKPDPKLERQVEAAAKKHGFANMGEYDDVSENISLLMSCIDPKTKAFSEPKIAMQKQIDEIKADKTIPEPQKKQMLEDLNEALKTAEPIKFPSNIELIKKYYDKLDSAMQ
jgi:hypothetical protein